MNRIGEKTAVRPYQVLLRWILTIVTMILQSATVFAELTVTPFFSPSVYVDDNRRLRVTDGSGLVATVDTVAVQAEYSQPTFEANINPQFRITRNSSQKELDAEDYFVDIGAQKLFERNQFSFGFGFARELSAATEIEEAGVIDTAVPKTALSLNSSWVFEGTDQFRIISFAAYNDTSYEEVLGSNLFDYVYARAGVNLEYDFSAQTKLFMRTSIARFKTPSLRSRTTSYDYNFGFRHMFDPTLTAEFLVGQNIGGSTFSRTETVLVSIVPVQFATQQRTVESRASGQVIQTRVDKEFDRNTVTIEWNRSIGPSSLGSRQKRQDVIGTLRRDITPMLRGVLNLRYGEQEQEATTGVALNAIDRYTVGASLIYRFSRTMNMRLDYRYAFLSRVETSETADSSRLGLTFVYSGEPIPYLH